MCAEGATKNTPNNPNIFLGNLLNKTKHFGYLGKKPLMVVRRPWIEVLH